MEIGTRPTVRVYDGDDEQQTVIAETLNSKKSELEGLGKGILKSWRRHVLKKEVSELAKKYDDRSLELGLRSKYPTGSRG